MTALVLRCRDCEQFVGGDGYASMGVDTFPNEGWTIRFYCKKHGEDRGLKTPLMPEEALPAEEEAHAD